MNMIIPVGTQRTPVVLSDKGYPSAFHRTPEGLLGERVTEETATHTLVVTSILEPKS